MGTRNPMAGALSDRKYHQRVAKSGKERAEQKDTWDRGAKHKGHRDGGPDLQLGDTIEYENKEGIVKTPNGPADLVGVSIDGAYRLLPAEKLKRIEESLERMRELSK